MQIPLIWLQNIQQWIGPSPFFLTILHYPHTLLYLTLPLSASLFLQFSEPNTTPPTCEPSLEGGATPPYPPMLQLRLLLNWPLWCGGDHQKLVMLKTSTVEVSFSVHLRWAVCVGPILFQGQKYSQQFWCFLELVLTSKAFLTPHYNQSDSIPPAYSPRKGAGHICLSFGNPEKVLYDDKYPVKTGTKKFLYDNHHSKQRVKGRVQIIKMEI